MRKEYIEENYNKVEKMTAVCVSNTIGTRIGYPMLVVGKTYNVTHIQVMDSYTYVILEGFGQKEFNSVAFELYENGEPLYDRYTDDPRFWSPPLRAICEKANPNYLERHMAESLIPAHIYDIEKQHNVKVLYAVEYGSRGWGFESKNSDWDVRFIYVHKPEWYLRVEPQRDVIEHMYEDRVDLAGWELRKALSLLKRSNPALLEWLNSPKVYHVDDEFKKRIDEVSHDYFNPIRAMYHYNNIYNKQYEQCIQEKDRQVKHFMYYLRGVLACKWIEEKNSLPPVRFKELMVATVDDEATRAAIERLLEIKKKSKECDMSVVDGTLLEYARQLANHFNETIKDYRPETDKSPTDALDRLLYDMVMANGREKF